MAPPPFALDLDATMDGNTFQARWAQLPPLPVQHRPMKPLAPPLSTATIEGQLKRVGIHVIASGNIPPGQALKFFFYARQATGPAGASPGDIWFLTELILAPGGTAQCSVKAENAQAASVDRYHAMLWESLNAYIT